MKDTILCLVTNLFRIYLISRFILNLSGKARVKKRVEIFFYILYFIVNSFLFLKFHTVWINVVSNVVWISSIVWLHTKSIRTNLFITSTIYLVNAACDVAGTLIFISYKDGVPHSQVYAVVSVFLTFICELIAEKIVTVHSEGENAKRISLILVPLCSIAVMLILVYSHACTDMGIVIVSVGFLTVNFIMLFLYDQLQKLLSKEYESELLRQKIQIYSNQINIILQSQENLKILRHDIKHHLNELKILANKNNNEEIKSYINQMEEYIQNPEEYIFSQNPEIDSVLNYMLQKANEELSTVVSDVKIPEDMNHSFDIIVLLGNLMENAIEAARQTEKKYLNVRLSVQKGIMIIRIQNSYSQSLQLETGLTGENNTFFTTKADKDKHGLGLKSVRKIVDAYHGEMEITTQEDLFTVKVILYI